MADLRDPETLIAEARAILAGEDPSDALCNAAGDAHRVGTLGTPRRFLTVGHVLALATQLAAERERAAQAEAALANPRTTPELLESLAVMEARAETRDARLALTALRARLAQHEALAKEAKDGQPWRMTAEDIAAASTLLRSLAALAPEAADGP